MQLDANGQQPPVHHRGLVRGQVVAHDADGQAGLALPLDLVQEVPEVDGPVLGGQLAHHLAGGGVQRGEQSMVPCRIVVVAAPLRCPGNHWQHRRGPLQRLDLRLLVYREHRRIRRRRQVQLYYVPDLSISSGSGEILKSSILQGCSPKARQIRCTLVGEIPTRSGQLPLRPVRGALRDLFQRPYHHLLHQGIADGARHATAGARRPARPAVWPGTGSATSARCPG